MRGLSPVAASGGHSSSRCAGLSLSRPLPLWSTGSRRTVVVAHWLSCSAACEIFPDQGSNPCALHWQADSQPLRHQGSPVYFNDSTLDILNVLKHNFYLVLFSLVMWLFENTRVGLPWWSSGWDSALPLQEVWVQSQAGELGSCIPHGAAKTNKQNMWLALCFYWIALI